MNSFTPLPEVRARLEAIFPDFALWLAEDCDREIYGVEGAKLEENERFTECGLFLELVDFLKDDSSVWQPVKFTELAELLEGVMVSAFNGLPATDLLGAIDICFLETVGHDKLLADALRPYLKPRSRLALDLDIPEAHENDGELWSFSSTHQA